MKVRRGTRKTEYGVCDPTGPINLLGALFPTGIHYVTVVGTDDNEIR